LSSSNLNWTRQGLSQESLVGRDGVNFGINGIVESTGLPYSGAPINPRVFYTQYRTEQIGDPFVYKGDFIKLRNITLTYDLTSLVSSKLNFIKRLTLSAACRNV
jgi:hypothetical protein